MDGWAVDRLKKQRLKEIEASIDNGVWIINKTVRNPLFFLRYSTPAPSTISHTPHSHSIVPGGLLVTSYTTRFTPLTSLMMRVATLPKNFMSKG